MKKRMTSVLFWPVDYAALAVCMKASGLSQSDVIRTLCRQGLKSLADKPISEFRDLATELELEYAVKQFLLNKESKSDKYKLDLESKKIEI